MGFDLAGKAAVKSAETELPHTFRKSPESLAVRSAVKAQRLRTSPISRGEEAQLATTPWNFLRSRHHSLFQHVNDDLDNGRRE
jgi:hypothetical protein